jgi:hypothetical protein
MLDAIGLGIELHVVADADRRHDEAHLDRELATGGADAVEQVAALRRVDHADEAVADFELEQCRP